MQESKTAGAGTIFLEYEHGDGKIKETGNRVPTGAGGGWSAGFEQKQDAQEHLGGDRKEQGANHGSLYSISWRHWYCPSIRPGLR